MSTSAKVLRPYQTRMATRIHELLAAGERQVAMIAPTGSGKSLIVRAVIGLGGGFEHVVIAVPMVHVQSSFLDDTPIEWGGEQLETCFVAVHGAGALRDLKESFVDLWMPVTTHAALARLDPPDDCSRRLLVLDEGHHSADDSGNRISGFRDRWLAAGGSVLLVTATPFRNDRAEVLDESWARVERTITEHISPDDGGPYGPSNLVARTVVLDGLRPQDKAALSDGRGADTKSQRSFADQVVAQWVADGRPKTIVIVPACDSEGWTLDVLESLYAAGVPSGRVLDATGTTLADKHRTQSRLDAERDVTAFAASGTDVMIGCRRFDEASDWPACSHVYVVGYPRSVPLTLQRWGRTFRSKSGITGHPCPDVASISFFVPQWSEAMTADAGTATVSRYRDDALLLAACLNDYTTALPYAIEGARARKEAGEESQIAMPEFDPASRAEAIACIAKLRAKHESIPDLIDALAALPKAQACAALTILAERVPGKYHRWLVRDALDRATRKAAADGRRGSVADRSLVAEHMVAEFKAALVGVETIDFESFGAMLATCATFTGQTIADIQAALAERYDLTRTTDEFDRAVHAFAQEHGRPPVRSDGREWDAWRSWLYLRGVSFSKRIVELGYGRTMENVRANVQRFASEHGRAPVTSDGQEWMNTHTWLVKRGTRLNTVATELGLDARATPKQRTIELFRQELEDFIKCHERSPKWAEMPGWPAWLTTNGYNWSDLVGSPWADFTLDGIRDEIKRFAVGSFRHPAKRDGKMWLLADQWLRRNHKTSLHTVGSEVMASIQMPSGPTTWTPELVVKYRSKLGPVHTLMLDMGDGATCAAIAERTSVAPTAVGALARPMLRRAHECGSNLPAPFWLEGSPGNKRLRFDDGFAAACSAARQLASAPQPDAAPEVA
jgi:hypothetical protein